MFFYRILRLILIFFFMVIAGCATTDATRTKTEGTAAGAAIGAGIGAGAGAIFGAISGDPGKGAAVGAGAGAIIGGIAGYFYGDSVAEKKLLMLSVKIIYAWLLLTLIKT